MGPWGLDGAAPREGWVAYPRGQPRPRWPANRLLPSLRQVIHGALGLLEPLVYRYAPAQHRSEGRRAPYEALVIGLC